MAEGRILSVIPILAAKAEAAGLPAEKALSAFAVMIFTQDG
jgi:hypothetical protein